MTEQEAIKILKINCICSPKATEFIKASNVAIKALEKQIPRKPKFRWYAARWYDVLSSKVHCESCERNYFCPECECELRINKSFCPNCGIKIDWSDEE